MVRCTHCKKGISPQEIKTERFTGEDDEEYVTFSCPSCEILLEIQKGWKIVFVIFWDLASCSINVLLLTTIRLANTVPMITMKI